MHPNSGTCCPTGLEPPKSRRAGTKGRRDPDATHGFSTEGLRRFSRISRPRCRLAGSRTRATVDFRRQEIPNWKRFFGGAMGSPPFRGLPM
jgi:hypothetical protein